MGRSIGSLGRRREPLELEFEYFGATIRVHPQATDAVELEFLEAGRDIDVAVLEDVDLSKVESMEPEKLQKVLRTMSQAQRAAHVALLDALRRLVHPDDWDTYWRLGNENGQQIRDRMADVKAITAAVVAAETDFPTGRRAGSPAGPEPTPPASADVSPSPAPGSDLDRALALERGRPDIQEFFVMQAEDRERADREHQRRAQRDESRLAAAGFSAN